MSRPTNLWTTSWAAAVNIEKGGKKKNNYGQTTRPTDHVAIEYSKLGIVGIVGIVGIGIHNKAPT